LVITAWFNKKAKEREELEKLRTEKHEQEVKNLVEQETGKLETTMDKRFNDIDEDLSVMKKAQQKDIRRSLRQDGKMFKERGWASDQEKEEFDELYWSYHNLGKNGVVDQLHKEILELPSTPPKDK
jgi:hypothetical protein